MAREFGSVLPHFGPMRISLAATNPCHVWDLAVALHRLGGLSRYYSGYPRWKLRGGADLPVRGHSLRTLATYALHGNVPERFRPSNRALFRWQDEGFDRWVSRALEPADFHHGIPGQCREAFRRARSLGIRTVLNHATGPARQVARILRPEYDRADLRVAPDGGLGRGYLERVAEEFELAEFHCCASSVVRDQLVADGVAPETIWVVPYGADPAVWHPGGAARGRAPGEPFRLLFAGQVSLRKGLRFLLAALEEAGDAHWELEVCGPVLDEAKADLAVYRGKVPVRYPGAMSQIALAERMRRSDLLVLPSLEEGFGLVVVQALACGLPCAVSSMVGAKDLIEEDVNGSVFAAGDAAAILAALRRRADRPVRASGTWDWAGPAGELLEYSRAAREKGEAGEAPG